MLMISIETSESYLERFLHLRFCTEVNDFHPNALINFTLYLMPKQQKLYTQLETLIARQWS